MSIPRLAPIYSSLLCLVAAKNGFLTDMRVSHGPGPSTTFRKLL